MLTLTLLIPAFFLPLVIIGVVLILMMIFVIGALRKDAVQETAHAAEYVLLETVGILLMTLGGLPMLDAVLSLRHLPTEVYLSLLLIFTVGGLLYFVKDRKLRSIGTAADLSIAVMTTIWRLVGCLIFLAATLSLCIQTLLQGIRGAGPDLVFHVVLLLYACLLLWSTRSVGKKRKGLFGKKK